MELTNKERETIFKKYNMDKGYIDQFIKLEQYMSKLEDGEMYHHYEGKLFFEYEMSHTEKLNMIQLMHESYFNTSQDKSEFAEEFTTLIGAILNNSIPLKLQFLIVEEIYQYIFDILSSKDKKEVY